MGIVRMGPPEELVLALQEQFGVTCLIETGTYFGGTALWASERFDRVVTIENSLPIYQKTLKKLGHIKNIEFLHGHTLSELNGIVPGLADQAIFWLDAHWSGGETYGIADECPILAEIEIINRSDFLHFLLIDDARLFTAPPPLPHNSKHWPDITALLAVLNSKQGRYTVIVDDVVLSVPDRARSIVEEYCRRPSILPSPSMQIEAGWKMMINGLRMLARL